MKPLNLVTICILFPFLISAQQNNQIYEYKPTIMVIPSEILSEKINNGTYEMSADHRMLMTALKEEIENEGFTTIGFESVLKKVSQSNLLEQDSKSDIKTQILNSSGSDFYAEFREIERDECMANYSFKIKSNVTSEDIATVLSGIKLCNDPALHKKTTPKYTKYRNLANHIINSNTIRKVKIYINELKVHGIKISANFTVRSSSDHNLFSPFGDRFLEEIIENKIEELSEGKYKVGGVIENKMIFTEILIPFMKNNSDRYNASSFARDIRKHLRNKYKIACSMSIIGSSIHFEIL